LEKKSSGKTDYLPDKQDIVYLNFNPVLPHEKWRRRPAVVLSNEGYSQITGLVVVSPIRSEHEMGFEKNSFSLSLEVDVIDGYVDPLHIYTLDFESRNMELFGTMNSTDFQKIHRVVMEILN